MRRLALPLLACAAGALALTGPSIAGGLSSLLGQDAGGSGCWHAQASRYLVSYSPVRSQGTHCGPTPYGGWRWSGTTNGPVGPVTLRWTETIRPDGRARPMRLVGLSASPSQATAARRLYVHVRYTTVQERAGTVRSTLHGWQTSFAFRPLRGS